ncbi:MAG: hypothetical protein J6C77_05340 [Muribaculaceae bacterium]|nr:hypothetical protein [Muribaculaceae bacterium]
MKKLSILFIFALIASFAANAELSQKALNMRSQIKSYINSLGYSPYIDEDGDISFTYDGSSYYMHLQDYKDAVAVSIVKGFSNDTDLSHSTIDKLCWSIQQDYILVKVYPTTSYKTIRVEVEALYKTAAQVKQFFDDNLTVVSIVADALVERYSGM